MSKLKQEHYDLYQELTSLSQLLDEYQAWFYKAEAGINPPMPKLFVESMHILPEQDISEKMRRDLEELKDQHDKLEILSVKLSISNSSSEKDEFFNLFRMFMKGLQKNCQALILEEWGLDVLTGLKNKRALFAELSQEMERLARHGQAFSLAFVRIDEFEKPYNQLSLEKSDELIKSAAVFIRNSLRSFDGAYSLGHGEFALSLKQADILGGQKALERLSNELDKADLSYTIDGQQVMMTMSCCVSSPLPDDDLTQLLDNLRYDLSRHKKSRGSVMTYHELSPLQQFVKTGKTSSE
jgi:diguanylate cyclase (GGDEF)-like protein